MGAIFSYLEWGKDLAEETLNVRPAATVDRISALVEVRVGIGFTTRAVDYDAHVNNAAAADI